MRAVESEPLKRIFHCSMCSPPQPRPGGQAIIIIATAQARPGGQAIYMPAQSTCPVWSAQGQQCFPQQKSTIKIRNDTAKIKKQEQVLFPSFVFLVGHSILSRSIGQASHCFLYYYFINAKESLKQPTLIACLMYPGWTMARSL